MLPKPKTIPVGNRGGYAVEGIIPYWNRVARSHKPTGHAPKHEIKKHAKKAFVKPDSTNMRKNSSEYIGLRLVQKLIEMGCKEEAVRLYRKIKANKLEALKAEMKNRKENKDG